jgi:adenine-specific DNA-methyltransferase
VLARLIHYCTALGDGDTILDFFAGSASTAEAVRRLNQEFGGTLRYVMVQMPEPAPE